MTREALSTMRARRRLVVSIAGLALLAVAARATPRTTDRDLLAAAARGDAKQIAALAGGGADVNARDADGRPALVLAARSRQLEAVGALLQAGADPSLGDRSGWTALH
jgi:ankyrin repeat protein